MSSAPKRFRRNRVSRPAIESLETRRLLAAVFSADFESPLGAGWTSEGDAIWHRSNVDSQSGDWALYYGDDTEQNYDLGHTQGSISTPTFSLAGTADPKLTFRYYMQIEKLLAEDAWVQASGDNGANWTTLAASVPLDDEATLLNDTVVWQSMELSLADFTTNTVKLRFYFNSNDEYANDYFGFIVDDVTVTSVDAPPVVTGITPSADLVVSTPAMSIEYSFSEAVTGVDVSDLVLSGPAAAGASVTGVSGAGSVWTFSVSGLSTGILTTTLAGDTGDIVDSAGQSMTPAETGFRVILADVYDATEGNGSFATAANLGLMGGTRSFGNLTIHSTLDEDYYAFVADESGTVTINLAYIESDWQLLDVFAYDSNQQLIPDDPADNTITFGVVENQTYYIKVHSELSLYADNYSLNFTAPFDAPHVTQVWVKGSTWSQGYRDFLAANTAGSSSVYGYAVPVGTGSSQLQTMAWRNLNQISIKFDEPMSLSDESLTVVGVVGTYEVSAFAYSTTTNTATWTLARPIGADRLYIHLAGTDATLIALDGEWLNPTSYDDTTATSVFPSGNGIVGGDFQFRIDVLPGDSTGGSLGRVNVADVSQTSSRSSKPVTVQSYRSDFDGNNAINVADVAFVSSRSSISSLPPGQPLLGLRTGGDLKLTSVWLAVYL